MSTFAEELKAEAKTRLGYTQPETAAVLGVSPRTVWRWLNGESEPTALVQGFTLSILRKKKTPKSR